MKPPAGQNRIRKNARTARANWLYSAEDVQRLYGISPATVRNWCKYGLKAIETKKKLFRGSDLNAFHQARNKAAKAPCAAHEIFCVCCKQKHSLLIEPFHIERQGSVRLEISVTCPDTGGKTKRFIRKSDLDGLRHTQETKASAETPL